MIVNGHGGNRGLLEVLAYEFKADFELNACALHIGRTDEPDNGRRPAGIHAARDETSLMLALAPDRVRCERTVGHGKPLDDAEVRATIVDPGELALEQRRPAHRPPRRDR